MSFPKRVLSWAVTPSTISPYNPAPAANTSSGGAVVSDIESNDSFTIVPMAYGALLGQVTPSNEWMVVFDQKQLDSLYFGDYLSSFHQLLRDMKDKTVQQQGSAVNTLTSGQFSISHPKYILNFL